MQFILSRCDSFQETKVIDDLFPLEANKALGYPFIIYRGQKFYNGVAIMSKIPFENSFSLNFVNQDTRHIAVEFKRFLLHNFYIPAGGDIPDIKVNDKFLHKVSYISQMKEWFLSNKANKDIFLIAGDLKIAPYENDFWSTKHMSKQVSHIPLEREILIDLASSLEMQDTARLMIPMDQKIAIWWSYRSVKLNRGLRIDHIWINKVNNHLVKKVLIAEEFRKYQQPSDHVP